MPKHEDHINQFKNNLYFLQKINETVDQHFDWKVTVCFYCAVHLVNSHLTKFDLQYRNHNDVNYALNPEVQTSITKIPQNEFISYISLQNLSRRSRYLVNEKDSSLNSDIGFYTFEKHYAKSLRHLDILINFFNMKYSFNLKPIQIKCDLLNLNDKLNFFLF